MSWLTPDIVDAVCRHMNDDHAAETLDLARVEAPDAISATVVGLDLDALVIDVRRPEGHHPPLRLPWPEPLRDRADIRRQIVVLHESAHVVTTSPEPAA
jgi:hypothetical protein